MRYATRLTIRACWPLTFLPVIAWYIDERLALFFFGLSVGIIVTAFAAFLAIGRDKVAE